MRRATADSIAVAPGDEVEHVPGQSALGQARDPVRLQHADMGLRGAGMREGDKFHVGSSMKTALCRAIGSAARRAKTPGASARANRLAMAG